MDSLTSCRTASPGPTFHSTRRLFADLGRVLLDEGSGEMSAPWGEAEGTDPQKPVHSVANDPERALALWYPGDAHALIKALTPGKPFWIV